MKTRGVIFDLDGVIENDDELVAEGVELLWELASNNVTTVVLTNDIRSECYDRMEVLIERGLPISRAQFLTPYDALALLLERRSLRRPVYFGSRVPEEHSGLFVPASGSPDCIVLGDVANSIDDLAECFDMVTRGIPLLALQKNPYLKNGCNFRADVGYHIAAWEYCLDKRAELVGKPGASAYRAAIAKLACKISEAIIISDSFSVDIAGAKAVGIAGILYSKYARPREIELAKDHCDIVSSLSEIDWNF
jgi:ribonucleotide monophosphatase NagD (HAD superfamily)